ncbi:hypothetical protein PX699_02010 [Sphingobium sp. H39-3-25]|nr:hypothetical protein [Sphingobium arseniciresistens]
MSKCVSCMDTRNEMGRRAQKWQLDIDDRKTSPMKTARNHIARLRRCIAGLKRRSQK